MARKAALAALLPLLATAAAPATTPAEAFACNLGYEAAMQSLATLKVVEQKTGTSLLTFTPLNTVIFEPGDVRLFGAQPTGLSLELTEPSARDPNSKMRAEFISLLPRTEATDDAVTNGNAWHLNLCKHLNFCIRARDPARGGSLELHRNPDQLRLVCRYEMTMSELEAL